MSKKEEKVNGSAIMKYRFITKRDNNLEIIVVRNVWMPKKIHVVNDDIKITVNPFKRTAKLYIGDRKNDVEVKKVEIDGDTNINIDLDVTYKISGEAYFEDYWEKKNARKARGVGNKKLLEDLDEIKTEIVSCTNGNFSRASLIHIKEVLNVLLYRDISDDELNNKIRFVKSLISEKINDPSVIININDLDDIINDAKIIFEQPINSNNQDVHRRAVKGFSLRDVSNWKYNHGATRFYNMAENKYSDIEKHLVSEINTQIKTICAHMTYEEVKNIKHIKQSILDEINANLSKYGIEVTTIRVQHVDQFSEELDAAGDKVKVAQREKEAIMIKANAEAAAIRAKGNAEAEVERAKQQAIADGVKAKADALEGANLDSSTKTALAGSNVSTFNLNGLGSVFGQIASNVGQSNNQQAVQSGTENNFREEEVTPKENSAVDFWTKSTASKPSEWTFEDEDEKGKEGESVKPFENEFNFSMSDEGVTHKPHFESDEYSEKHKPADVAGEAVVIEKSTSKKSPEFETEEELYVRLEQLHRLQKLTLIQMKKTDEESDEFTDLSDLLEGLKQEENQIQKKLTKN